MMNKYLSIFILYIGIQGFLPSVLSAQVLIGIGEPEPPHPSAILELKSLDKDKGFLGPRVKLKGTKDITTIADPANGLLVYNVEDANTSKTDSVKANRYYYWAEQTGEWLDFLGQEELRKTINEVLTKIGVPQSVIYPLRARDKITVGSKEYTGMKDLLAGIEMGSAKNVLLDEGLNYTNGKVKLDYDSTKIPAVCRVVFEPGVYYIAFSYEVIPYKSISSTCTNSSYYMDFPTSNPPGSRSHSNAYHGTGLNSMHGKSFIHVSVLDKKVVWKVDLGVGVAGDYLTTSGGKETDGFFFSDKGTYLYILRLGDVVTAP
ncbi:hypothetical protein [Dysgonomonas macrotermitis]|nr:hypothetical protein [Dysgonomonas macrotermitis]